MTQHDNAKVASLGYIGIGVKDIDAWKDFAQNVLGLQIAGEGPDGATLLRMDEYSRRFMLHPTGEDDIIFSGFEVPAIEEFEALEAKLNAAGVETTRATDEEKKARGVVDLFHCKDPDGLRTEIYYGPKVEFEKPFHSPRAISGFVTGDQGFGHMVLSTADMAAARNFYENLLGFLISDYINMEVAPEFRLDLVFLHCNPRHHTLALAPVPIPNRLLHFMVQLNNLDDVGSTLYIVREKGIGMGMDLGKHTNDHMVSFYMKSPSGFEIEYGWGARVIDDATWNVVHHTSGSIWGHTRPAG
ncbi:MAG TPA: biphenyl-2,3-diol 1,2-dioxygenase [Alphaproteobacteria bacterium]|jgi:2,3-dihydroxybiphenyl 1,2-dioxygenase|nr:biphenyl-2,3-diol 1,2-dioxygenase [Alphaproteobacteria bacterium]HAM47445.1 biphenyl-2,3-diol 1,2-dioxygenase [Alphaproteobacteria bacterium]HBA42268.1 biphenyl-2,3-diol 1,2-dioxygenase [Alphaproteobacteria bacterium]HBC55324.1 biphenyl-2,3-diol 1,2-dioxygenase [Alphaproteobacteria bacterium]HBF97642.1 biphenyl-2,3-diol 1,2-dioxygenase [Alphaproteobacteria bacterium]